MGFLDPCIKTPKGTEGKLVVGCLVNCLFVCLFVCLC